MGLYGKGAWGANKKLSIANRQLSIVNGRIPAPAGFQTVLFLVFGLQTISFFVGLWGKRPFLLPTFALNFLLRKS